MNHVRHAEIYDATNLSITLVGAGGIGAMAGIILAKMGVGYLTIYDDDVISEENLPTQMHLLQDLGLPKVDALNALIEAFSDDTRVTAHNRRVDPHTVLSDQIIIAAVDSIQARKDIWQASFDEHGRPMFHWYIDSRMAAEEVHLYCVYHEDFDWYDQMVLSQDDADIPDLPCTRKSTIFTSSSAAGLIGKTVRLIAAGLNPPKMVAYNILLDQIVSV